MFIYFIFIHLFIILLREYYQLNIDHGSSGIAETGHFLDSSLPLVIFHTQPTLVQDTQLANRRKPHMIWLL